MNSFRIGITGADGFLGWHLRAYLHGEANVTTTLANRATFQDPRALERFAGNADAIIHLAGMNRGDGAEIWRANTELAQLIIDACDRAGAAPHVVFANSTHHLRPGPYGESKRAAAERLAAWASRSGAKFTNVIMPHLFGEHGRPFYNSAIATFCHQLVNDESPRIIDDGEVELLHSQAVVRDILRIVRVAETGEIRFHGHKMRISRALAQLTAFIATYRSGAVPSIATDFDLDLFNTLRSYLFPERFPLRLDKHSDDCGSAFNVLRTPCGGQCFLTTTSIESTRGNLYHRRAFNRLLITHGEAIVRIRRLFKERVHEFHVSGVSPCCIDLPTLHTHSIANIGQDDLVTLHWAHGFPESDSFDTHEEQV